LLRYKLLFIETQDNAETSYALMNYVKVRYMLSVLQNANDIAMASRQMCLT